jgi:sodium-dependent dicarboxylate transporter 2/3/5
MSEKEESRPGAKRKSALFRFIASLVIGLGMCFLLKQPEFSQSQVYVIFILFFAISLWLTEAIPAFAVSLLIVAFLVFALGNSHFNSNPQKVDIYVNTFSSNVIWLMLSGFFLASGMTKTRMDESLLMLTIRMSGTNPRNLLAGLMTTTMVVSMITSNTATTAMVIAAVMPLLNSLGKKSGVTKALLLGVPIAASTGGMATIIGSPPNAIAVGALNNAGINIDFFEWMKYGAPLAVTLTAICCFALIKMYMKDVTPISMAFLENRTHEETREHIVDRRIVMAVLCLTVLLWLTGSMIGITVASVAAIPIVFLTLTGIVTGKDVQGLPWDTLLLVAGGLSLGLALQHTGLLDYYANKLHGIGLQPLGYMFILAYIAMVFSNIMSHTATSTVLIPLGMVILSGFVKDISIIIALAASTAMFLPVSTPPNAIAYSTGMIELKDFRMAGLLVGLLGPVLVILWIKFLSCF